MLWLAGAALLVVTLAGLVVVHPWTPAAAVALGPPHFVDEAASAGLVHRYGGEYPYVVGGGLATFDCDGDGLPDLYLAGGGAGPAELFRNVSPVGGALRFEPVHDPATDLVGVTGAYPLDIDGDGHEDLAVLRLGENVLLRGLGDCRFERANERFGLDGGDVMTVGFSATWEGSAALPTLAFGNYLEVDAQQEPTGKCVDNALLRPAAGGTTYGPPTVLRPGWCSLSMLFSDWDRSGRRDLRVSNDRYFYRNGEEQLWRMEPGVAPRTYTADEGWAKLVIWGMGIASQDITGDGYPEIALTSQGDNKLQTLANGPTNPAYQDIALSRNATAHRPYAGDTGKQSTGWHPEFTDVNNDAFPDLFISKGNVATQPDYARDDPSNLLIGQADGTFVEGAEAAGIMRFGYGRGAALVDLNLDGLVDLVLVRREGNVELWRNVGTGTAEQPVVMGHWLALDVAQDAPNRDAIGGWVEIRVGDKVVDRELTVGGGHASGERSWLHVGLGTATSAQVRVIWPDGEPGPWLDAVVDGFTALDRASETATRWTPR